MQPQSTPTGPTTLYRGGPVYSTSHPDATALLVAGDTVAWLGPAAEAPTADRTVELDGALVTPAFVDAHVHLTDTGLARTGLDLSGTRSAGQLLDAVAAAAAALPAGAVLLGHGWDESTWDDPTPPDPIALDRAAGGRLVYAAQASLHSALASSALLPAAAGHPGYDPSGWVRQEAHHAVRSVALGAVTMAQRRAAQQAALTRAAAQGIAAVHECGGPSISSEADFTAALTRAAEGDCPEVYGLWGELGAAEKAKQLGALAAGGDLFADGALGARTARLRSDYLDGEGGCGHAYLNPEQVRDHLLACHRAGIAGGFHAIGDAALATVLSGFAGAAQRLGTARLRSARHRIEHVELVDRAMIAQLVGFGVIASVQPAFDRLWGGEHQLYAQRLGPARALAANPFGALHAVGVPLTFGSDSPVTPLDPWGTVRAAIWHHNPPQRLSLKAAFAAHTRGGWRAVGQERHGVLSPGAPATFAVWHTPAGRAGALPKLLADDLAQRGPQDPTPLPRCRRTVLRGEPIFDAEEEP
ncbi:amidohydrolase family protein [Natronosporangium hydrolyticum]|uniref:Amidohydrolase family protein n=1 Tax=Natronosporangium hydrolyticum TaxID=2811111 RepID=A0A895Y8R1_9ACTN|nr:amidohydrolase family protein [Natronosporangium hydrolyticum]QSB12652.1 amidohydrolase family protein [Natronosporangium hydrolyticum]